MFKFDAYGSTVEVEVVFDPLHQSTEEQICMRLIILKKPQRIVSCYRVNRRLISMAF